MDVGHEPDYKTDLLSLVEHLRPARLLCIGPEASIFTPYAESSADRRLVSISIDEVDPLDILSGLGVFDFAFISDTVERMEKSRARVLLSRLRDLHSRYLALLVPVGEVAGQRNLWAPGELLALGMVRRAAYRQGAATFHLYTFDVATYKFTPDWFNPKYWAHPERWDKDWW
jgi:hypothetical protein